MEYIRQRQEKGEHVPINDFIDKTHQELSSKKTDI